MYFKESLLIYGYIYKTTNLVTGKIYIGRHKAAQFEPDKYIGSGIALKRAIEKYGKENFKCELVESADDKDTLNEKEKYWIKHYRTMEQLYNISAGGESVTEGLRKVVKGETTKYILVEEIETYLADGWVISIEEKKKAWRDANSEKIKEYRRIARKNWKAKNPDKVRESKRKYMKAHPEKNREYQARYMANEENRLKHNERVRQRTAKKKEGNI